MSMEHALALKQLFQSANIKGTKKHSKMHPNFDITFSTHLSRQLQRHLCRLNMPKQYYIL